MDFPESMRGAILVEQNKPLHLAQNIFLPEKLEFGQVLVKVCYSGICGSQIGEIDGAKGEDPYLPHLLGHEGSGLVIDVGAGVKHVKAGDHVVMHWRKGEGLESFPPSYKWNNKKLNAGFVTTFNEYAVVSENRLTPIPKNFDLMLAPLFGCAVTTGFGVVLNNAVLKIGESVVVFGAGGIGLNIIQAAAMVNAYPIVALDIYDNKLEMAKKFGATHCINSVKKDVKTELNLILGETGADVIVDNTGNSKVISTAYELTSPKGRTILVGVPKKGDDISIYSLPLHFEKVLTGSHGGEAQPAIDIPRYIRLYQAGRLKLQDLITDVFSLSEINTAISKLRKGEIAGRCLIKMND